MHISHGIGKQRLIGTHKAQDVFRKQKEKDPKDHTENGKRCQRQSEDLVSPFVIAGAPVHIHMDGGPYAEEDPHGKNKADGRRGEIKAGETVCPYALADDDGISHGIDRHHHGTS